MGDEPVPSSSLFDRDLVAQSILQTQMNPSAPAITQLQTGTNLLIGDRSTQSRMDHFPDDLYDLRDESHLVRFVSALLGDSGAGQLRKRFLLSRIHTVLDSAAFFDLDGFYGAIFGNGRRPDEDLGINPYVTNETPEAWDSIAATDARYRERITALAASIPMAGTLPGIRQAAEAIVGAECDIYEVWRFMDSGSDIVSVSDSWNTVEGLYPTWNAIEGIRWNVLDISGFTVGNLGVNTAAEVIVRVKKTYDLLTEQGVREQVLDEYGLMTVLDILRPANAVISVSFTGIPVNIDVPIGSVHSDSEFWEVITKVVPNVGITPTPGLYALSPSQKAAGVQWGDRRTVTRPALVTVQGLSWEQASAVVSVSAATISFDNDQDLSRAGGGKGTIVEPLNYQTVSHLDGSTTTYSAERGAADPRSVQGGIAAANGVLTAAPFSAPRTKVTA